MDRTGTCVFIALLGLTLAACGGVKESADSGQKPKDSGGEKQAPPDKGTDKPRKDAKLDGEVPDQKTKDGGDDADAAKPTKCGNNLLDGSEKCDGLNLNSKTCKALAFDGGTLACKKDCTFDTTNCYKCGDSNLDPGEACDGTNLNSKTCKDFSFAGGTLACKKDCTNFDTSKWALVIALRIPTSNHTCC